MKNIENTEQVGDQHPTNADLRFICKEAILIAGAAAVCAVHLWQRSNDWLALLFGLICVGFLAVAISAGLRHWSRP